MKYLMLVCVNRPAEEGAGDLGRPVGAASNEMDVDTWVEEMDGRGVRLLGEAIRPGSDSTTVRVRDGKVLLTDGPYAETKDVIAGFDVLDCVDLDEAVEVASKHPMARSNVVELRPFWE
ncbi:YciI family protein [Salinispora oceanensis]|uniref:YciI family protein n=1 Tax=Salinispora oceanensis TaxID=1050199 RepID=UPI0003688049|nr:YciI family protein [Salinispora oceanensis]